MEGNERDRRNWEELGRVKELWARERGKRSIRGVSDGRLRT